MADEELVELLRQGSEVWNRWRKEQPEDREIDLSDVTFFFAPLGLADLHRADLSGARLNGTNLGHANLQEADLRRTYLHTTAALLQPLQLSDSPY
jgi:hypothetical protein